MEKPSKMQKEELLEIAAQVVAGKRNRADLEAYGIELGELIVGEEAKQMLLQELKALDESAEKRAEHIRAAETLWRKMAAEGVQEGSKGRFQALFFAQDRQEAESLAAELGGDPDWEAKVSSPDSDGRLQIRVVTRPLTLGREVVVELANQMAIHGQEFGCEFVALKPLPTRRPWWRFW